MAERRVLLFAAGLLVTGLAIASPLDEHAADDLTAHMLQHVLLLSVAGPLLAFGTAGCHPRSGEHALGLLAAATALQSIMMVWWHVPAFYDAAVDQVPLHMLEHLSFLAGGWFFWWAIITAPRRAYGFAVLALFASTLPCTAIGAGLTLSSRPWYGAYPSIADQQLAGVVMWVVPGLVFIAAGATCFAAWLTTAVDR